MANVTSSVTMVFDNDQKSQFSTSMTTSVIGRVYTWCLSPFQTRTSTLRTCRSSLATALTMRPTGQSLRWRSLSFRRTTSPSFKFLWESVHLRLPWRPTTHLVVTYQACPRIHLPELLQNIYWFSPYFCHALHSMPLAIVTTHMPVLLH